MPSQVLDSLQVGTKDDEKAVLKIISDTLLIPVDLISPELGYQSIVQWDSIGHINLMLALEKHFQIKIQYSGPHI